MRGLKALDQETAKLVHAEPAFLYAYFKMNVETNAAFQNKKDIIVFRLALDRWPVILFSFVKSLVPFPESIKELYEDPRNRALPKNYVRFIKWRLQTWTRNP